ncbi:MAG TPA: histidinol dehydrogenase [Candidatus Dormibacteraeota bacterium]|nr:histidinol dehydrogenase [Candidatus Dormibacteraeota bacterium]
MKTYRNPPVSKWPALCQRPLADQNNLETIVRDIFEVVKAEGDGALLDYTRRFDGVAVDSIAVSQVQLAKWAAKTPKNLKAAINQAYANITKFHAAQKDALLPIIVETQPGVRCWREPRPIERVGLYIPGGSAPLLSTVLMLGVPAQLAGCREIVLCTPPGSDGSISTAICYAAGLVGATKVMRIGGSQAIAAMTCGTLSVPEVDKIFGPGNQYVTAAKLYAGRLGVAIDMPAGPSELMVVADTSARADFVAADLLSQAEHGPDSQVVLVTTDNSLAKDVEKALVSQLSALPRRKIAEQALSNSFCVIFANMSQALAFANEYAPEHLILSVNKPRKAAKQVQNAGSVFLGNYSPESAGDYASGTNHTLPTNGWTRSYGGLSLKSFYKYVTFQSITKSGARRLAPTVMAMAQAEGLEAHKRAMEIRL